MGRVSRRTLLTRAGIGTGAGVFALLGTTAAPAFGAASITDLSNVRLVCVAKRIAINWDTQWVNTPAAVADDNAADVIRAVRVQEQGHYETLAPLLDWTLRLTLTSSPDLETLRVAVPVLPLRVS